ncbi:hypothetical protein [Nonomuraea sp. NPDC005650]
MWSRTPSSISVHFEARAGEDLPTVGRWRFTGDFHHPVHLHLAHLRVI